jgi:type IV fimbrial biogenesis protein FimT
MLKPLPVQRGMTLVEIMISLAVLGILLMVALPNFAAWLQNQQLRGATEGSLNGLQIARAEAIRRNVFVQLALGPGTGWTVSEAASGTVIQSKVHEEGTSNAVVATTPGGSSKVTFTPLGGVGANTDASATITQLDFTNPSGGNCQPSGPMRCLRVVVTGGGSMKMCDPALPVATPPDPRACP